DHRGGSDRRRHRARDRRDPGRDPQGAALRMARSDDRSAAELRPVRIQRRYTRHAEGSVLIEIGHTQVLCTASVEEKVPPFLKGRGSGWVTAEYGMLPRATHTRATRGAASGKQSGPSQGTAPALWRSSRRVAAP